jgi:hypothetical protein
MIPNVFWVIELSITAVGCKSSKHAQIRGYNFFFAVCSGDIRQRFVILKENGAGDGQGAETVKPRNEKAKTTEVDETRHCTRDARGGTGTCRRVSDRRAEMKQPSREMAARADEARAAESAKTARLRALRLAKEAADREVALHATPVVRIPASTRLRRTDATRSKLPLRAVP